MNVPGSSDSVAASPEQTGGLEHGDQQESIKTDKMASDPLWNCFTTSKKTRLEPLSANPMCGMKINKLTLQLHKRKVPVRFLPLYLVVFQSVGGCILLLQTSRLSFWLLYKLWSCLQYSNASYCIWQNDDMSVVRLSCQTLLLQNKN